MKTYSGEVFIGQLEIFQEYVERLAQQASPGEREQMSQAFQSAIEHELVFLDTVME